MALPMISRLVMQIFKKPATNPFPARYLPDSVTDFLHDVEAGRAKINPAVNVPEGYRGKIQYDSSKCNACGLCARVCPANAIEVNKEAKNIVVYVGQCIACGQCTDMCNKSMLEMGDEFLSADTDRYSKPMVVR